MVNTVGSEQVKQTFLEDNTDYTEIDATEVNAIKGFRNINEDEDEIWLLQCPKGFDVQNLEGHKLKFPGRIKINESEAIASESTASKRMAFGYIQKHNYNIKLLPVAGKIVLRDRISAPQSITEENLLDACPPITVPMPEYIKLRHPLLGDKFEEHQKTSTTRNSSISTKKLKKPKKEVHLTKKRTHSATENEDSDKKSTTVKGGKTKKLQSDSLDISDDLKWIKEL